MFLRPLAMPSVSQHKYNVLSTGESIGLTHLDHERQVEHQATCRQDDLLQHNKSGQLLAEPHDSANVVWPLVFMALGLLTSTAFSVLVLASSVRQWTTTSPSRAYILVTQNRATVQLLIQLLSNGLALINTAMICNLINFATRVYWAYASVSLNTVRFWNGLCMRSMDWGLPLASVLPLAAYILLTAAPAAVWVGALTPVAANVTRERVLRVPAYANTSLIKEWPAEIGAQGPLLSTEHGIFSYSVGLQLQASLMASASSASTIDGKPRQHAKLDHSQFTYLGRSYGVGASAGLEDKSLQKDWVHSYTYKETGFDTTVSCIHNTSTRFRLIETGDTYLYRAVGLLPNSGDKGPEDSTYIGHGTGAIVSIGVGRNPDDPRRMLAIAAGKHYSNLHTAQCSFVFKPTSFKVDVGIRTRTVTVTPLEPVSKFYPSSGNLTQTLMRQFELISNAQTTMYVSALGNAFNQSISDYVYNSQSRGNSRPAFSSDEATLPGLENALTVMTDDMLVAYAGAQMYIQKDVEDISVLVTQSALRIGADVYVRIIFAVNVVITLFVVVECMRTKHWKHMPRLDYLDPGALMVASGGNATLKSQADGHGRLVARLCENGNVALTGQVSLAYARTQ